jgi:hypothetical protein
MYLVLENGDSIKPPIFMGGESTAKIEKKKLTRKGKDKKSVARRHTGRHFSYNMSVVRER